MSAEVPRHKAHAMVAEAVRTGVLHKPSECSRCGTGGRIIGHHDDYSKPLEVLWLCGMCHAARHRELGWGYGGAVIQKLRKGRTKEEYEAAHEAYRKERGPVPNRRRLQVTITMNADLARFAKEYFPTSEYRSLSAFIEWHLSEYVRTHQKQIRKAGVSVPQLIIGF